jgi:hypothetical protein
MIIDPFPSFYCVVVVKIDFWRLWVVGGGRVKASTVALLFNATTFTEFSPQLVKNNQNTLRCISAVLQCASHFPSISSLLQTYNRRSCTTITDIAQHQHG